MRELHGSQLNADTKLTLLGALKSAVSSICGLVLSLPIVDPQNFSLAKLGGWKHIAEVALVVLLVAEARYFQRWADAVTPQKGDNVKLP